MLLLSLTLGKVIGKPTSIVEREAEQISRMGTSLNNVLYDTQGMEGNNPPLPCQDKKSPCKCKSQSRGVVSKSHVYRYTEYVCLKNKDQDGTMLEKLHKSGLNMECHQLQSTMKLEHCDANGTKLDGIFRYRSGCENRYIDRKSQEDNDNNLVDLVMY